MGDIETRPKKSKKFMFGALPFISWDFCFSAVATAHKKKLGARKKS
jgi:hypothetical protein